MINIFVENFIHHNKIRADEIAKCKDINKRSDLFSFNLINSNKRMTYQDIFNYINCVSFDYDINVLSNIDIVFDDTIKLLENITDDQFIALTRYEFDKNGNPFIEEMKAKYSQDVWAWRGKNRVVNADFYLGIYGCDNRLAYEARQVGYEVINPSYSIFTYHYHKSNIRADDYMENKVNGPQLFVFPSVLK